jgi:DNA-binding MarR family transcriptional regulator
LGEATAAVEAAMGRSLAVGPTDRRALDILYRQGPLPTSRLARALDLTRGGTTTVVDRLVGAELVRRGEDILDRRRVIVSLTTKAYRLLAHLYEPIDKATAARLRHYTVDDLTRFVDMLDGVRALQAEHLDRIQAGDLKPVAPRAVAKRVRARRATADRRARPMLRPWLCTSCTTRRGSSSRR